MPVLRDEDTDSDDPTRSSRDLPDRPTGFALTPATKGDWIFACPRRPMVTCRRGPTNRRGLDGDRSFGSCRECEMSPVDDCGFRGTVYPYSLTHLTPEYCVVANAGGETRELRFTMAYEMYGVCDVEEMASIAFGRASLKR